MDGSVLGAVLGTGVAVAVLLPPPGLYAGGTTGFVVLPDVGLGAGVALSVSSNVITYVENLSLKNLIFVSVTVISASGSFSAFEP